jgi:hypothetical protein
MSKSLFTIDPSEKQRILEMHQSATRKQYLGEQSVPTQSATPEDANKESLDYRNDPDLINIQNNIKLLNQITKNFPTTNNVNDLKNYRQEFWYDMVPKTKKIRLLVRKLDDTNTPSKTNEVFGSLLGTNSSNIDNFNPGSHFSNANLDKIKNAQEANTALKQVVTSFGPFVRKFSPSAIITSWDSNGVIIQDTKKIQP